MARISISIYRSSHAERAKERLGSRKDHSASTALDISRINRPIREQAAALSDVVAGRRKKAPGILLAFALLWVATRTLLLVRKVPLGWYRLVPFAADASCDDISTGFRNVQ